MPQIPHPKSHIPDRPSTRGVVLARAVSFVAILALLNALCVYALPAQIDLTRGRTFSLAPQTVNLLNSLESPLDVAFLAPRTPKTAGEINFRYAAEMFRELLETCRRVQPALRVEELDPAESDQARQLLAAYRDAAPPCVLMTYGSPEDRKHEVLSARDLAEFRAGERGRVAAVDFFGEQALAAALARMTAGATQGIAYASVGHGELALDDVDPDSRRGLGTLSAVLRELDCELRPLDFGAITRIPADASFVLVAGGEQPWTAEESAKLEQYLKQGGRALILVDFQYDARSHGAAACGLEDLLSEFGVAVGNDRVITRGFTGQIEVASPALPVDADHPLVRSLPLAPIVLYECRSLNSSAGVRQLSTDVIPLLVSHPAPRAWAEGDFETGKGPEPGGTNDSNGPVAMAVAVERSQEQEPAPALIVVGDAEFVSNRVLAGPAGRTNSSFALSCLNWLRGRRELLGDIPPRRHEGYRLPGSSDEHRSLVWKSSLLLWTLITAAGVTMWTVRRAG